MADIIGEDTAQLRLIHGDQGGTAALTHALANRGMHPTSFEDWGRIDAAELERGSQRGKLREKIAALPELLQVAGAAS